MSSAAAPTADYYKCSGKVGGEWNYGRAPQACNADAFGSDNVLRSDFAPAIFDDVSSRNLERDRYMQQLYSIVRDAAVYYMKKRKPQVSAAELEAWTLAIVSTASHESYASHYRKASDGRLKMMRGDVGHGHGLMQIDDRHHFPAITNGVAWNLITNLTYGMDIYYASWERAPSQSCVGSATNYEARIRAAWSAYNGGPSQICRWVNTGSKWSKNDVNFYNMLKNQTWRRYVSSTSSPAQINVPCLIEKRENCARESTEPPHGIVEGQLYKLSSGAYCVAAGKTLQCVSEFRDAICLGASSSTAQVLNSAQAAGFSQYVLDRHELCRSYDKTLHSVGDFLEMQKNINVRETPGGGRLAVVLVGDVAEVLDFEVREAPENDRYYKIRLGQTVGYIFSGTKSDHSTWTKPSNKSQITPSNLARDGDRIRVVNGIGINLRKTAGGTYLTRIPAGVSLTVQSRVIRGKENYVYYKVTYGGSTGYIYSGLLIPNDTTSQWTERLREI